MKTFWSSLYFGHVIIFYRRHVMPLPSANFLSRCLTLMSSRQFCDIFIQHHDISFCHETVKNTITNIIPTPRSIYKNNLANFYLKEKFGARHSIQKLLQKSICNKIVCPRYLFAILKAFFYRQQMLNLRIQVSNLQPSRNIK